MKSITAQWILWTTPLVVAINAGLQMVKPRKGSEGFAQSCSRRGCQGPPQEVGAHAGVLHVAHCSPSPCQDFMGTDLGSFILCGPPQAACGPSLVKDKGGHCWVTPLPLWEVMTPAVPIVSVCFKRLADGKQWGRDSPDSSITAVQLSADTASAHKFTHCTRAVNYCTSTSYCSCAIF